MKASYANFCARLFLVVIVLSALAFGASKEKTLYAFQGGNDGANPYAPLITDAHGNLYGVTSLGGGVNCGIQGYTDGCGTVFELIAPSSSSGTWQEVVLYAFHGTDGAYPYAPLTFDKAGNLYGTTELGGDLSSQACGDPPAGCGVVFELSPPRQPGGNWTQSVLYAFEGDTDGFAPESAVVFDSSGNLYGTTLGGGISSECGNWGTAYELSPSGSGWTETVVYTFCVDSGAGPAGAIVLDSAGNLYGTTTEFDTESPRKAFELSPSLPGQPWTETTMAVLGTGTVDPAGLVRGSDGNFYGSDETGGSAGEGTIFQLALSDGVWTQNVIYTFSQNIDTGPQAVIVDSKLNIYFMAFTPLCGGAYKLTAMPGNTWKPSQLYSFTPHGTSGCDPRAALTIGKWGALYGTMSEGGNKDGDGVVFAVEP